MAFNSGLTDAGGEELDLASLLRAAMNGAIDEAICGDISTLPDGRKKWIDNEAT